MSRKKKNKNREKGSTRVVLCCVGMHACMHGTYIVFFQGIKAALFLVDDDGLMMGCIYVYMNI